MSISSGFQNFAGSFFRDGSVYVQSAVKQDRLPISFLKFAAHCYFSLVAKNSLSFEGHQKQEKRTIPESMGQSVLTLLIESCGQLSAVVGS